MKRIFAVMSCVMALSGAAFAAVDHDDLSVCRHVDAGRYTEANRPPLLDVVGYVQNCLNSEYNLNGSPVWLYKIDVTPSADNTRIVIHLGVDSNDGQRTSDVVALLQNDPTATNIWNSLGKTLKNRNHKLAGWSAEMTSYQLVRQPNK